MTIKQFVADATSALGADRVVTDSDVLTAYSHDWWPLAVKLRQLDQHPYVPEVAVRPRTEAEAVSVVSLANENAVPLTAWGLGSSVTGAPLPTKGGVTLDLSELVGDPDIDRVNHTVRVAAGVRGTDLESIVQAEGFTLGHSPQSLDKSSVGGWLATLATGQFSSRYGGIEDLVVGYTLVRADGRVLKLESHPRAALGPDFRQLFLGSEGTLGVITEVTLKIFPIAEHRIVEAFTVPSVEAGIAILRELSQSGLRPFLVRFYDLTEARLATRNSEIGSPVLFLGHEGIRGVAEAEHAAATAIVTAHSGQSIGPDSVEAWLAHRFDFSMIEKRLNAVGGYAETIEVAANWSNIGELYTSLTTALAPLADEVLGHFSHIYPQGTSLYVILLGSAASNDEAAERIRKIWETAMRATSEANGELSHHHGVGLARKPYLTDVNPAVTDLARDIKAALDPKGILNPGKLFDL
jgi:alkyldihydroxyacetonephosphate synthase